MSFSKTKYLVAALLIMLGMMGCDADYYLQDSCVPDPYKCEKYGPDDDCEQCV